MRHIKHNLYLRMLGEAASRGDLNFRPLEYYRMIVGALKEGFRIEMQLEQKRAELYALRLKMDELQLKYEKHLSSTVGMVSIQSACKFSDPKPDLNSSVPLILTRAKDGETPNLWACPKCGKAYVSQAWADNCCFYHAPRPCVCGKTTKSEYQYKCDDCATVARLIKAKQVPESEYSGYVFSEHMAGYEDGYYRSADYFREAWGDAADEDSSTEMPCYVWACTAKTWGGIDLDRAIEGDLEEHFEDAADHIVDEKELYDFVADWNKKQHIVSYTMDPGRVVVLDQVRFDALIGKDVTLAVQANDRGAAK